MDISKVLVEEEEGAVLELKDPTGEPILKEDGKPVTIRLAGTDSTRWRKAEDAVGDRRLKSANPRNGVTVKSMDEARSDTAFLLASATISWDGIVVDGEEWPCTLANAKKLYLKYGWVREQVDNFIGDRRNFLRASSQS